jgi:uroporphyrinogen decarboxylase
MMTERERYHATTHHQRPDRLLYGLSFTPDLQRRVLEHEGLEDGADLNAHFDAYAPEGMTIQPPADYREPDWAVYFDGVDQPEGSRFDRNGCLHVPTSFYHFTHRVSPLRNVQSFAEIRDYPWKDWASWSTAHFEGAVAEAHAEGRVASAGCTHMYEEAWQVRGYEPFLIDMMSEPEAAHFILDHFKTRNRIVAEAGARAGADQLYSGDDVANQNTLMFSREMWREFIGDKWAEVYAAAKTINPDIKVWYHSDGDITTIMDDLIEIGVDIFNPLQPECVDLAALKQRYGSRIVIDGTIGTQTTMPFGSPDDVRTCVRERVKVLGQDGALILTPTHVLEPEVPIANILAFVEACKEYGRLG